MTTDGVVSIANKFPGGAGLNKERQGFASFVSFQNACFRNGTAMTMIAQDKVLSEQYFVNPHDPDSIGISQQLVPGYLKMCTTLRKSCSLQAVSRQQVTLATTGHWFLNLFFIDFLAPVLFSVGNQSNQINLCLLHSN
jgi:hypothetical protein